MMIFFKVSHSTWVVGLMTMICPDWVTTGCDRAKPDFRSAISVITGKSACRWKWWWTARRDTDAIWCTRRTDLHSNYRERSQDWV